MILRWKFCGCLRFSADKGNRLSPYDTFTKKSGYSSDVVWKDVYVRYRLENEHEYINDSDIIRTLVLTSYRCFSYNRLQFFQHDYPTEHFVEKESNF